MILSSFHRGGNKGLQSSSNVEKAFGARMYLQSSICVPNRRPAEWQGTQVCVGRRVGQKKPWLCQHGCHKKEYTPCVLTWFSKLLHRSTCLLSPQSQPQMQWVSLPPCKSHGPCCKRTIQRTLGLIPAMTTSTQNNVLLNLTGFSCLRAWLLCWLLFLPWTLLP